MAADCSVFADLADLASGYLTPQLVLLALPRNVGCVAKMLTLKSLVGSVHTLAVHLGLGCLRPLVGQKVESQVQRQN
jgi:hypothetical protein